MYTIGGVAFCILALRLACNAAPIWDDTASKMKPRWLSQVFIRSPADESQLIHPPPTEDNKDVTVFYFPGLGTPSVTARAPETTNENGHPCSEVCPNTLRMHTPCNPFMAECGCKDFTGTECQMSDFFSRPKPTTSM
ncbi:hypothetical protein BDZ89DRAFT_1065999, partial [Hymenopellis radicata]